jgi:tRNA threonylcarbamoyladenosine biosynthesis protein TsaE
VKSIGADVSKRHFLYWAMTNPLSKKSIHEYLSSSEEQTAAFGHFLGQRLSNAVLALSGELGAGKTLLSRAICEGAGVKQGQVQSPTFTLINEYDARVHVYHMDTYRLDPDAFCDLGIQDILRADGLKLIEWAERIEDALPASTLWVELIHRSPTERLICLSSCEPQRWQSLLPENLDAL